MRLFLCLILVAGALPAERFDVNTPGRIVRPSDPQISPDGKSIAAIVSRANFEENRSDSALVLIDTASGTERVLTRERRGPKRRAPFCSRTRNGLSCRPSSAWLKPTGWDAQWGRP